MLVDIYVELPARTTAEVECFLNQLLPERRLAQDDFEIVSGDGDEAQILEDEKAVLACLESQAGAHCAIYWTNPNQEEAITSAHAFILRMADWSAGFLSTWAVRSCGTSKSRHCIQASAA